MKKALIMGLILLAMLGTAEAIKPAKTTIILHNNAGTKINATVTVKQTINNIEHVYGCQLSNYQKIGKKYLTNYICYANPNKPATLKIDLGNGYIEQKYKVLGALRQINIDKEKIIPTIVTVTNKINIISTIYSNSTISATIQNTGNQTIAQGKTALTIIDNANRIIGVTIVNSTALNPNQVTTINALYELPYGNYGLKITVPGGIEKTAMLSVGLNECQNTCQQLAIQAFNTTCAQLINTTLATTYQTRCKPIFGSCSVTTISNTICSI